MKEWYKSKAIVGILVLLAAFVKNLFGIELLSSDEIMFIGYNVETVVTGILALIASAVAIYGRVFAKDKIVF